MAGLEFAFAYVFNLQLAGHKADLSSGNCYFTPTADLCGNQSLKCLTF